MRKIQEGMIMKGQRWGGDEGRGGCEGEVSRKRLALNEEDLPCGQGEKLKKQVETR